MPPQLPTSGRPSPPLELTTLDQGVELLVELSGACDSPKVFLRESVRAIAALLRSPYAGAEVRYEATVLEEEYSSGPHAGRFWGATAHSLLTSTLAGQDPRARLYHGRRIETRLALFSCPVSGGPGRVHGALVVVAPCADEVEARHKLEMLGALAHLTAMLMGSLGGASQRATRSADAEATSQGALKKVARYGSGTELAFSLTNKLRTRDGCDQVTLALVDGRSVDILSISGQDHVSHATPGVRRIREALEEGLDLGRPIVHQTEGRLDEDAIVTGTPLHRQWSEACGGAPVATIPLRVEERVVALLGVRRARVSPFTTSDVEDFRELVEPYVPAIELVDRARRSLVRHALSAARNAWSDLKQREHWKSRSGLLVSLLTVLWLCFGSIRHEVRVPCSLAPTHTRKLAAPFDGVLAETLCSPGDRVRRGQVLARLDTAEIELEIERLRSELAVLHVEESSSLAADSPVDLRLVQATRRQTQANLDLQLHRLERATLRSSVDGVVLSGDLHRRVGDLVPKGDPLFELSADEGWVLELRIPEADVADVAVGLAGRFASRARPDERHEFVVVSIDPRAEKEGDQNVFLAEAVSDVREEWMRTGMEGLAEIDVGDRSPLWVAFHRVIDSLRMSFWL